MSLKLQYPSLISEICDFAKNTHAEIVYKKCLNKGKLDLAEKIAIKYKLKINSEIDDDAVIAIQFVMMHNKK